MTLDEAIAHAKEVAKEMRKQAAIGLDCMTDTIRVERCKECAEEHEQLASWLTELQERRKADRWISVKEAMPNKEDWYEATFSSVTGARYIGLAFYSDQIEDFAVDGVIAWRPLPKPYESEVK